MRLEMLGALTLLLAACGSGGTDANQAAGANSANAAKSSEVQNQVRALPEGQRNAMLIRAIRDARMNCQHVENSTLSEASQAVPVYLATCDDGSVYAVAIANDGNATVQPVSPPRGAGQ